MNSTRERLINITIDCIIIGFSSISSLISITMFTFIIYNLIKRRTNPNRIALLLTANMYLSLILFFILIIITYKITLEGHINIDYKTQNNFSCRIRAYLLTVFICAIFYSNTLQAIYRLCRVVFYTRKIFQSFQIYLIGILFQWIICFLIILPALIFNYYEYLINDYHCQIPYKSFQSIFLYGTIVYHHPSKGHLLFLQY